MELDRYKNDGSILFSTWQDLQTTDGNTTSVITSIKSSHLTGFKQLNTTHVVIVAYNHHCIKMLNRLNNRIHTLAGTCKMKGFVEGNINTGKMNKPWGVEVDNTNLILFVTDRFNQALRAVNKETGQLSTVISSGFKFPKDVLWVNERGLFVTVIIFLWLNLAMTQSPTSRLQEKDLRDMFMAAFHSLNFSILMTLLK